MNLQFDPRRQERCPDMDGDGWADVDDALQGQQWSDADGDGYGDNNEGTTPDDCPTVRYLRWTALAVWTRTAMAIPTRQHVGRESVTLSSMIPSSTTGTGTRQLRQRAWTDRNPSAMNTERRGRSRRARHRRDLVANGRSGAPTKTATAGTSGCLPQRPTQWSDMDGDGYGDNASGNDADQCPEIAGTSTVDRLGCEDTDETAFRPRPKHQLAARAGG